MLKEKKKKEIKKIIKGYQRLLELNDYRVISRFRTSREDNELKDNYALVRIDNYRKIIFIKLNAVDFEKMQLKDIKKLSMHELLHSFFWELSNLFDKAVDNTVLSESKKNAFKNKFDETEHAMIHRLIKIFLRLDKYKLVFSRRKRKILQ